MLRWASKLTSAFLLCLVLAVPAWGLTLTVYPDPNVESTSVDGRAFYSSATGDDWASMLAAAGNNSADSAATTGLSISSFSALSNKWATLTRVFTLFDTSALTSAASISAATVSLVSTVKQDDLAITPTTNIYASTPASNTAIVNADYGQTGTTAFATALAYSAIVADSSTYNVWTLNATGIAAISKTSITKFSVKNANYDVAAVGPTWTSALTSAIAFIMADTAGTSTDPKLDITYELVGVGLRRSFQSP